MTFFDARDELITIITDLGYKTYTVAPIDLGVPRGMIAMLFPAGPQPERFPGGMKKTTYNQRIQVMQALEGARAATVAANIQNAAIAIGGELDQNVTLNGKAVETGDGVEWDDAALTEYPPGKGILFLAMTGTLPIVIDEQPGFQP